MLGVPQEDTNPHINTKLMPFSQQNNAKIIDVCFVLRSNTFDEVSSANSRRKLSIEAWLPQLLP